MFKDNRKATVGDLPGYAIMIVVLTITIAIGASILATVQSTQTENSTAYNVTGKGLSALGQFGDYFGVIVVIIILVVIVGLLGVFLLRKQME